MDLFRYLLRASRRTFFLAICVAAVSGLAGAGFIAMVNLTLARRGDAPASLVGGFVLVCLCALGARFASQVLLYRLSQGAICELRLSLTESILGAPLRSVERMGIPRLFSTLTDDVLVIASALPGLPLICASVAFAAGCVVYLAALSPAVALITLVFAAAGAGVYRAFAIYGMRSLRLAREEQDRLFDHFRGVTEGIKELKLNRERRESLLHEQLSRAALAFRDRSVVGLSVFEGAAGGGQSVFFLLTGVLLFLVPRQVELPSGILASCVLTVLFAVTNLQSILVWLPVLGRASVALKKVEERRKMLGDAAEPRGPSGPPVGFDGWQRLRLQGVVHVYPGPRGEEFVLGPIDLELRRGEVVFVVGANGSGKTTLAKVLTGLYPPENGTVRVDETEIDSGNRESYRQLFSAVFSDFFLFDTLVGAAGGDRTGSAQQYLSRLELDHKVSIQDGRFSTTALSQGQRKRLALLAAYLEDRDVYVFDEWAADQDPAFKELFYTHLVAELKGRGKAVFVITHDDRYFALADRLVRLDYGRIRQEEFPHEQPVAAVSPDGLAS